MVERPIELKSDPDLMNIIGPDALVFGVDDVAACTQYLIDYGLQPVGVNQQGGRFEALDGTAIVIAHQSDPALPPSLGTASMLRKTVYGVADAATLSAIAEELGRDRDVKRLPDGVTVRFVVTDTAKSIPVAYRGPLPDLFREGKGVVTQGRLGPDGVFHATEVLAKHDENYTPPEAAEAVKRARGGQPQPSPTIQDAKR